MNFSEIFASAFPKAVDFVQPDYDANAAEVDAAATANGYRKAGVRLGFVVFTTKPEKKVDA